MSDGWVQTDRSQRPNGWASGALLLAALAGLRGLAPVEARPEAFLILFALAGTAYVWALRAAANREEPFSWMAIAGVALALRALGAGAPMSDDVFRYLWEGRIQAAGFNPYAHAPADAALAALRPAWHAQINQPDLAAGYGPVAEGLFAAHAVLGGGFESWRVTVILADLAAGALLIAAASRCMGGTASAAPIASPPAPVFARWAAVAYLWNPLIVYEFSHRGHLDAFLVLGAAGMLWAHTRGRTAWLLCSAAFCVSIKAPWLAALPWALALTPARRWWVLVAALALPWLPYLDAGRGLGATLWNFGTRYHYNDGVHALLSALADPAGAKLVLAATGLAVAVFVFVRLRRDTTHWREGLAVLLGLCVLFSPTVHPWYATWVVPAAALLAGTRAARPWLAASLSFALAYGIYTVVRPGAAWQELPVLFRMGVHLPPWLFLAAWAIAVHGENAKHCFCIKGFLRPRQIKVGLHPPQGDARPTRPAPVGPRPAP